MHVRKVEIFIYSLLSPAEKLSLAKRLKPDLIPIIRHSNKGNASQYFNLVSDFERLNIGEISIKILRANFTEFRQVPNQVYLYFHIFSSYSHM